MTVGKARHTGKQARSRARMGTYANTATTVTRPTRAPTGKAWLYVPKVAAALVFVGSIWLLYSLFNSQRFTVSQATITGAHLIPVGEAQHVADIVGESIFRVNADTIERRLKDAFGCLDGASLRVRLPNQITITLREHAPVLVWQTLEHAWWVDLSGKALGIALTTEDMVIVRDSQTSLVQPGDYASDVPWQLAHELATALPTAKQFDHDREHGLVLHATEQNWPVYMGRRGDALLKVELMQDIVAKLVAEHVEVVYIDLRDERWPVYKTR